MRFDRVTPSLGVGSEAFWARLFSELLVLGHLPHGEPGLQVWSRLDLPLGLGAQSTFGLLLGARYAFGLLGGPGQSPIGLVPKVPLSQGTDSGP
jgi:hypothetical protein